MNEEVYRIIAKKYGVSIEDVKRDMQAAINEIYANSSLKNIPTVEEYIDFSVRQIKNLDTLSKKSINTQNDKH